MISHKRGVRFIWVAFYIQTTIKKNVFTKLTLPVPFGHGSGLPRVFQLSCPVGEPSLGHGLQGGHLGHISSCNPKIIFYLSVRENTQIAFNCALIQPFQTSNGLQIGKERDACLVQGRTQDGKVF